MKKEMLTDTLIDSLVEKGWFHEEGFFSPEFCLELLNECKGLELKAAQIGKGQGKQEALEIRNDSIFWIDEEHASALQKEYLTRMNLLMNDINRELFLGLREFECHFAHYKTSGFYKKHLDQHQTSQKRLVSAICYLNGPKSGGELVVYSKDNPDEVAAKIKPKPGSFVCFLSNQIYHEVLPTDGERFSVTGWFRTL